LRLRRDDDEAHAVGAGNHDAHCLRRDAKIVARSQLHVVAVDPPDPGAGEDEVDLLVTRLRLVVLDPLGAGRQSDLVDPNAVVPSARRILKKTPRNISIDGSSRRRTV
jgi:hypothetical protein